MADKIENGDIIIPIDLSLDLNGKIATHEEAWTIGKGEMISSTPYMLCTNKNAGRFGCTMSELYSDNRCVPLKNLSERPTNSIYLTVKIFQFAGIISRQTIIKCQYPLTSDLTITVECKPAPNYDWKEETREVQFFKQQTEITLGDEKEVFISRSKILSISPIYDSNYTYIIGPNQPF